MSDEMVYLWPTWIRVASYLASYAGEHVGVQLAELARELDICRSTLDAALDDLGVAKLKRGEASRSVVLVVPLSVTELAVADPDLKVSEEQRLVRRSALRNPLKPPEIRAKTWVPFKQRPVQCPVIEEQRREQRPMQRLVDQTPSQPAEIREKSEVPFEQRLGQRLGQRPAGVAAGRVLQSNVVGTRHALNPQETGKNSESLESNVVCSESESTRILRERVSNEEVSTGEVSSGEVVSTQSTLLKGPDCPQKRTAGPTMRDAGLLLWEFKKLSAEIEIPMAAIVNQQAVKQNLRQLLKEYTREELLAAWQLYLKARVRTEELLAAWQLYLKARVRTDLEFRTVSAFRRGAAQWVEKAYEQGLVVDPAVQADKAKRHGIWPHEWAEKKENELMALAYRIDPELATMNHLDRMEHWTYCTHGKLTSWAGNEEWMNKVRAAMEKAGVGDYFEEVFGDAEKFFGEFANAI